MSLIVTEAIILKVIKYGENSLICHALTSEHGLISLIASRGARHNKSISNHLQIMNIVQITYYPAKNNTLHRLKEVNFTFIFKTLHYDVKKSLIGAFLTEVILNLCKEDHSDKSVLFELLSNKLYFLDREHCNELNFIILALVEILSLEGILPYLNFSETNIYFNLKEGMFQPSDLPLNLCLRKDRSANFSSSLKGIFPEKITHKSEVIDDILKYFLMHIPNFKMIKSWEIVKLLYQ